MRYLGAHITTIYDCISGALEDRISKAIAQLQRLRFCPASTETKVRVIATKVYAGALYGVEATQLAPARIARLSAAVIDTFRPRNNSHNASRFFTTLTPAKNDLDPAAQILARRVMQIRRTCSTNPEAEEKFKRTPRKEVNGQNGIIQTSRRQGENHIHGHPSSHIRPRKNMTNVGTKASHRWDRQGCSLKQPYGME